MSAFYFRTARYFYGHESEPAAKFFFRAQKRAIRRAKEHGESYRDSSPIEYIFGAMFEILSEKLVELKTP